MIGHYGPTSNFLITFLNHWRHRFACKTRPISTSDTRGVANAFPLVNRVFTQRLIMQHAEKLQWCPNKENDAWGHYHQGFRPEYLAATQLSPPHVDEWRQWANDQHHHHQRPTRRMSREERRGEHCLPPPPLPSLTTIVSPSLSHNCRHSLRHSQDWRAQ